MPVTSVSNRITELREIFMSFGINVHPNSALDLLIKNEFGPGKRSPLNSILESLKQGADAAILAKCIGQALEKNMHDPEIKSIAILLQERLPSLFKIIDMRQITSKRIELLEKFLGHFANKIESNEQAGENSEQLDRLKRMLAATRQSLREQILANATGSIVEELGIIFDLDDVKRCGKIIKIVVPTIIILDKAGISAEQKITCCVNVIAALSQELANTKLTKVAAVLDSIHWLARVCLPKILEDATIEQALQNLNISLGKMTIYQLRSKAVTSGLTEKEIIRILYHNKTDPKISSQQQEILIATRKNQQYAAACGYVAQLGQELRCKELENVGIAGICMASMHQTYCELRTNSLNVVNFSESLGLILTTTGVLTKSKTMVKIGQCVLEGVKSYAGIMAIPGGQAVAIPLAICSTVAKIILSHRSSKQQETVSAENQLHQTIQQIVMIHMEMRSNFTKIYELLELQNLQLLTTLDEGFASILSYTQHCHIVTIIGIQNLEKRIDDLHFYLGKEFADLYLEHILNPIDEIEYYNKYKANDFTLVEQNKHKLCIWLLYKSKNSNVNGGNLLKDASTLDSKLTYLNTILSKTINHDAILGLINYYLNLEFAQAYPEDLPHVPSWILAANTYVKLLSNYTILSENVLQESIVIDDIINSGKRILIYLQSICDNHLLLQEIEQRIEQTCLKIRHEAYGSINNCDAKCLESVSRSSRLAAEKFSAQTIYAQAAGQEQQLEKFDTIQLDISYIWHNYLVMQIPDEIFLAHQYGIGQLQIHYAVDAQCNSFTSLRISHNSGILPDCGRDVIFRIDVSYKGSGEVNACVLITGLFAYDLGTAHKRFEEYYRAKFAYPLRHTRYLWISIDGMRNQVANNDDTETHKIINYSSLAQIYAKWWQNVQPVSQPDISARLRSNTGFIAKYTQLLSSQQSVDVQTSLIHSIKFKLNSQLQQHILQQRILIGTTLLESKTLLYLINKVDTYYQISYVLSKLVHKDPKAYQIQQKLTDLICAWQKPENWQLDYYDDLKLLFNPHTTGSALSNLPQSDIFNNITDCINRLNLLKISMEPQVLNCDLSI